MELCSFSTVETGTLDSVRKKKLREFAVAHAFIAQFPLFASRRPAGLLTPARLCACAPGGRGARAHGRRRQAAGPGAEARCLLHLGLADPVDEAA